MIGEFRDLTFVAYLDALREDYRRNGYLVHYEPMVYGVDFLPLLASSTQSRPTVIDHDADFALCFQSFVAFDDDGGNETAPNLLAQQIVESSGRRLQNVPTHIVNVFGTGARPHVHAKPLVIPARGTIRTILQDLAGADINVRISYIGAKIFLAQPAGPPGGERATSRSMAPTIG